MSEFKYIKDIDMDWGDMEKIPYPEFIYNTHSWVKTGNNNLHFKKCRCGMKSERIDRITFFFWGYEDEKMGDFGPTCTLSKEEHLVIDIIE